jgi:two-component system cell cycle response regulator DivK
MWNSVSTVLYPTVLVAEDSRDTRSMLKRNFELKGYRVLEAADGREALELARKHRPSLIVIDLNMPVVDGLEAIKNIRKLEAPGEQVPIVAITAFDVYGMKEAALQTGCNTYLCKPLDFEELDKTLKGLGFIV